MKNKILGFAMIMVQVLSAQINVDDLSRIENKTNSPYSWYGLGDFVSPEFAQQKGIGGTGIALRTVNSINMLNPASYSAQDTLAFIFDIGHRSEFLSLSTNSQEIRTSNANIDHIAIGFTLKKWWGASAGLVPYSKMAYNFTSGPTLPDSSDLFLRIGKGELNRIYFGNAFDITPSLSVGFNASYIFGKGDKSENYLFIDNLQSDTLITDPFSVNYIDRTGNHTNGVILDFGAQYSYAFNENNLIIGLTYQPKSKLNSTLYKSKTNAYPNTTLAYLTNAPTKFDTIETETFVPSKLGLGVAFEYKDVLTLAFDFKSQDWTNNTVAGKVDNVMTKSNMINFGIEYIPKLTATRNYFNKIRYRVGGYNHNTAIEQNDKPVVDKGLTIGLGLPYKKTSTMFNIAAQMGRRGSLTDNLIEENYIKLNINVSFFDFWFYKPKFD